MALKISAKEIFKAAAIGGLIAGLINVLLYLITKAAGVDFIVETSGKSSEITVVQPLLASLVGLLLGALLAIIVARFRNADTIWVAVVGLVFILDTGWAFVQATAVSTGIVLSVMHVVVVLLALRYTRPLLNPKLSSTSADDASRDRADD